MKSSRAALRSEPALLHADRRLQPQSVLLVKVKRNNFTTPKPARRPDAASLTSAQTSPAPPGTPNITSPMGHKGSAVPPCKATSSLQLSGTGLESPNPQRVGWHLPAQPAGTRAGDWGWRGLQPRTQCTSPASRIAPLLPQTICQRVKPRKQCTKKSKSQPKEQTHRFPPFRANLEELIWQDLFATLGMQTEEESWSLTFLHPPTIADRSRSSEQVRAPPGFPLTIISASRGEGAAQHSLQCWRPARLLGATTLELARSLLHGGSPGSRGQDFPVRRRQHEAGWWWWWSCAEPEPLPAAALPGHVAVLCL